ncbi:MAG: hypothetical protein AAF607_15850 [Pseudomonadota bacterium]
MILAKPIAGWAGAGIVAVVSLGIIAIQSAKLDAKGQRISALEVSLASAGASISSCKASVSAIKAEALEEAGRIQDRARQAAVKAQALISKLEAQQQPLESITAENNSCDAQLSAVSRLALVPSPQW